MTTEVKWIAEDRVIEKLREYSRKKTGSSKALSGTINQIIEEYLNIVEKSNPPTHPNDTHTHKKGIDDILEWIKANNSMGVTKADIEKAIKETKGMDSRTIKKYEPEVIHNLLSLGYQKHPINSNLYIRYEIPNIKERSP